MPVSTETREPPELEQARSEARASVRRGRVVTAVALVVVATLVAVVALLGGFDKQRRRITDVAPGATVVSGPFEIVLSRATVQRHGALSADLPERWDVQAIGTIRSTDDTSMYPTTEDGGFVFAALDQDSDGIWPDQTDVSGGVEVTPRRDTVSPGLAPVPYALTFEFTTAPEGQVLVGIYDQRYGPKYILDDQPVWQNTEALSKVTLPLEKLPDEEY